MAIDIDPDALQIFRKNCIDLDLLPSPADTLESASEDLDEEEEIEYPSSIECIQCDVLHCKDLLRKSSLPICDVIFTNPPFGTKNNAGIDMLFLQVAIEVSMHFLTSFFIFFCFSFLIFQFIHYIKLPRDPLF